MENKAERFFFSWCLESNNWGIEGRGGEDGKIDRTQKNFFTSFRGSKGKRLERVGIGGGGQSSDC
jgi:hypothetical protein